MYLDQFFQKRYLWSKTEEMNVIVEFRIFDFV